MITMRPFHGLGAMITADSTVFAQLASKPGMEGFRPATLMESAMREVQAAPSLQRSVQSAWTEGQCRDRCNGDLACQVECVAGPGALHPGCLSLINAATPQLRERGVDPLSAYRQCLSHPESAEAALEAAGISIPIYRRPWFKWGALGLAAVAVVGGVAAFAR